MRDVEFTGESIELFKLLKLEGLAESGGVAKLVIANGEVVVNGKVETQKRKKLLAGNVVEFDGESIRLQGK